MRRQFCQRGHGHETDLAEIAAVDPHDGGHAGRGCGSEVAAMGAVGGADLDQAGPALAQHIGDAKAAADLHQLAAADQHRLILAEAGQHQIDRCRVVVDDQRVLRPGQFAEQVAGVVVAAAPFTGGEIIFQAAVPVGHGLRLQPTPRGTAARGPGSYG